jgi:predicted membrane protein
MEQEDIDKKENTDSGRRIGRRGGGRFWIPFCFIVVGAALLMRQLGLGIPDWVFSWQILLIVVGIFSGFAHAFRGPGWLIMILIGSFFLMDQIIPGFDLHRFIWPSVILIVGFVMLVRPKKAHWMDHNWERKCRQRDLHRWQRRRDRREYPPYSETTGYSGTSSDTGTGSTSGSAGGTGQDSRSFSSEDYIDATTVLGGIHKNILSKNFKGGDVTIFMGGAEINLSQADIQGTATLDITQVMGGTKIIVPPHWEVRSQMTSVFGNIEDKRQNIGSTDHSKVLIIDGSSVFGGIEIRNY